MMCNDYMLQNTFKKNSFYIMKHKKKIHSNINFGVQMFAF